MCNELSEKTLWLIETVEDSSELRKLLEGACKCSCSAASSPKDREVRCRICHEVESKNRLLHILNSIGF